MKILVTGVAGFIGSKLALKLINSGYNIVGIDDLSKGQIENIPEKVDFINFNLTEEKNFPNLKGIDIICHLAGQSSGERSFIDPISDINKNVLSTINLLKYAKENKIKKFIHASSMSIYGDSLTFKETSNKILPKSPYGIGKLYAETYCKLYQKYFDVISLRMSNVYGIGQDLNDLKQGMVSIFLSQALSSKNIVVKGSLSRIRDFIHIDDVIYYWKAIIDHKNKLPNVLNIGTGIGNTVGNVLNILNKYFDNSKKIIVEDGTPGDQKNVILNIDILNSIFKHDNIKLDDGVCDLVNHYIK